MKTIAAIYPAIALVEVIKKLFFEHLPDCRLINLIDDTLIRDLIRKGQVDSYIARRLLRLYQNAVDAGADIIFNTCSSVGEVADIARNFIDIPILKIDEPMAVEAVNKAAKIGILATLPTTLAPTIRLVKSQAKKAGKKVKVIEGLAVGGFEALMAGNSEEHDRLIMETAIKVGSQVDLIVLAQGSMAKMEQDMTQRINKPVLSSPLSGVLGVKAWLED